METGWSGNPRRRPYHASHSHRDVWEMGYVVRRDDGLHFIHASERDGKVVEEPEVLGRYIKRHAKEVYGWRWIRIL